MGVSISKHRTVALVLVHAILFIASLLGLVPFIWMILSSIKPSNELFSPTLQLFPSTPTLENYQALLSDNLFLRWFLNSVIVASVTGFVSVAAASLAAYAITRFKFPGRVQFAKLFLLIQVFPASVLIMQIFVVMFNLGLLDTYLVLVLAHSVFALPFCIWMLISYFGSIPTSIEEAALVDGCTYGKALWHIVIPVALPGVIASYLFAFMISWQEYILVLTLTSDTVMRTVPVGLSLMYGEYRIIWGHIMAGSVLVTLPIMLAFLVMQKTLIGGLTLGSGK